MEKGYNYYTHRFFRHFAQKSCTLELDCFGCPFDCGDHCDIYGAERELRDKVGNDFIFTLLHLCDRLRKNEELEAELKEFVAEVKSLVHVELN